MGVAGWVAAQLDHEEGDDIETPQVRVTVRLDPGDAATLDEVAKYLSLSRTGCATRLLVQAIYEASSVISERDPDFGADVAIARMEAERDM